MIGEDREFDLAFVDEKNRVGAIALHEYVLTFFKFEDALAYTKLGKKGPTIKSSLRWLPHNSFHRLIIANQHQAEAPSQVIGKTVNLARRVVDYLEPRRAASALYRV